MNERITQAVRQASDTRAVVIERGALTASAAVFDQAFGDQAAVLIADQHTFAVAGPAVREQLGSRHPLAEPLILPGTPTLYAQEEHVATVATWLQQSNAIPVAIGSGTINDLTKLAAHRSGRPYMVVATAASMDGYTAFGAAITRNGFKQTMACPAPRAVIADLDVLTRAPAAMTAAGYGDLLGKLTAGGDWLIADALGIEPIQPAVWAMVQGSLRDWLAGPELLPGNDPQAVARLVEGLILTGLAMQAHQSSRPASGSEHQFSHLWEMQEQAHGVISHGFKVGVGSVAAAALYEELCRQDLTMIDPAAICRGWPAPEQLAASVRQLLPDPVLAEQAVEQSLAKYVDAATLAERLTRLRACWPDLRARLLAQVPSPAILQTWLQAAGCPTHPSQIGMPLDRLQHSYARAPWIRRRYTVFDLAIATGQHAAAI